MLLNTFLSEFLKLRSTRSLWLTSSLVLVISLAWGFVMARFGQMGLSGAMVVLGFQIIGLSIIMIQAAMIVTTEYRYGVQTITYQANPHRVMVAAVKLVLYAVIAAVLTLISVAGALFLADLVDKTGAFHPFSDDAVQRQLWVFPVGAALVVLFAQGVGWLVRQTAGTIAICFIFMLGLDQLVGLIPRIGDDLVYYSPFGGLQNWISDISNPSAPWGDGSAGYGLVFLVWGLVLWIGGVALLVKRDA